MPREIEPLLLDDDQSATLCGIKKRHFNTMQRNGRLGPRPIRFGKAKRFSRLELERWIEAGCPPRHLWTGQKNANLVEGK